MFIGKSRLTVFSLAVTGLVASCSASLDDPTIGDYDKRDDGTVVSDIAECNVEPTLPPAELELDLFYEKFVDANGIPIVASAAVSDDAMVIACEIVSHMVSDRADIVAALTSSDVRVGIIAVDDGTTDMPEHRNLDIDFPLPNGESWDERTRGVGATHAAPLASVGEENLLGLTTDRYLGQSILVHEFAHTIFDLGVATVDPIMVEELSVAFDNAIESGIYTDSYATTNTQEYWAEGVQSWYDSNPDQDGNPVESRSDLIRLDSSLALLISEVLPEDEFVLRTAQPIPTGRTSGRDPRHPRDDQ